jgi:hypothetical protein
MEIEMTPLLGRHLVKPESSSWVKRLLVMAAALAAISGLGLQFNRSDQKLVSISSDVRAHMEQVFDALITNSSDYDFVVECPDSTYAYCGEASCKASGTPGVSACGCQMFTEKLGQFSMDLASTTLIRSQAYREAALLAVSGDTAAAERKVREPQAKIPTSLIFCRILTGAILAKWSRPRSLC